MVTAFVLINVEGKDVRKTAEALHAVDGVTEVYTVAGEYDLIAVIRVADNQTLSKVVIEEVVHKRGVRHTKTLFALDAISSVDLESVFVGGNSA